MKTTFTTTDTLKIVQELREQIIGFRVNQVYDIDHKTYLLKLQKPDHKVILLLESAARIHITEYEWPKSPAPSGFSMKLRKHLRNKRLENVKQLGVDRIVDLTFGSGEAEHHLILELYDRGNIVLTDSEFNILNVLRPRKENEDTRIAVHQKYPIENTRKGKNPPDLEKLQQAFDEAKENVTIKKILNPLIDCGGSVLEHELLNVGISPSIKKGKFSNISLEKVVEATSLAQLSLEKEENIIGSQGYIIKKLVKRIRENGNSEDIFLFEEFHPQLYNQHKDLPFVEYPTFNKACDEFFSNLEASEVDKKTVQKEKEALKKLENVRRDHERRLQVLKGKQEEDMRKGQLIELNQELVEGALLVVRSAIANQIDWRHIEELLEEAQSRKDPVACAIKALMLESNTIMLWLSDPYDYDENDMFLDSDEEREQGTESDKMRPLALDINLDLSALANARRYYNMKRQAAKKEQKTIDASYKAIKSAEKKTQQTLKEMNTIATINKARKVHWFEKFLWFISTENYLVIGGRDSQQNEQIVKRHLKPKDIYVHADLHGASSVIIKNPSGAQVPPKTLNEAGVMALCYSRAWDEKVVTSAWWVWGQQVSKTAPAGEYLTSGAFMVRGKKNFLPPSHLIYGFGFLFRLEDGSVYRHEGERRPRLQDEFSTAISDALEKLTVENEENDIEIPIEEDGDETFKGDLSPIEENSEAIKEEEKMDDEFRDDDGQTESLKELSDSEDQEEKLSVKDETFHSDDVSSHHQFPDTELEISHLTGDQFTLRTKIDSSKEQKEQLFNEEQKIYLGDDEPVLICSRKTIKENTKKQNKKIQPEEIKVPKEEKSKATEVGMMKRGQKGKMKKMKKYKDQDEEEREMRMLLLQAGGNKKKSKKEMKNNKYQNIQNKKNKLETPSSNPKKENRIMENKTKNENIDDAEEDEIIQIPDDLSVLNTLTAIPLTEDELLYAIPVCAPYASMTNFKFKIKMTPGTGKKGKACKTALNLFWSDKSASGREKDLLRAVKDHELARNVPGKVKVSAPNVGKIKK